jgi:hypothetical protein
VRVVVAATVTVSHGVDSMEPPTSSPALPAVWICPRCGARLVSRNLWHSCGQYTLETLFAGAAPGVLELARAQATFALHRWLDSPRIVKQVDYGPRWRGHHVRVQAGTDLDDELRSWLQEAHDVVGLQAGLPDRTGRRPRASPGD